jgi:hypothetical protein
MSEVLSTNPVTGVATALGFGETSDEEVTQMGRRSLSAAYPYSMRSLEWRAGLLQAMASALDEGASDIIATAMEETGLAEGRLTGELRRTSFQFRFFASVVRDGGFLEASIDHAADTPMGPLPDLRRQLQPLGPVAALLATPALNYWPVVRAVRGPRQRGQCYWKSRSTPYPVPTLRYWTRNASVQEDNPLGIVRRVDGKLRPLARA